MVEVHIFNQVAQLGHFAGGLACVFGSIVLFGTRKRKTAFVSLLIMTALIAVKEFWYDVTYETALVRGSDLQDFTFYVTGMATALAAVWMKAAWGTLFVKFKTAAYIAMLAAAVATSAVYYGLIDVCRAVANRGIRLAARF
jgi:hypothetical protein